MVGEDVHNAITDVPGIRVGHATDMVALTGCTVVLCEEGATAGVDVRGSAPGTRETDAIRPTTRVEKVNAVLLTGGSAFGLDAAGGVMQFLEEKGYEVETAATAREAFHKAQESFFNVALIDINLPDQLGIEVLRTFRDLYPTRVNIMITASTTLRNAIDALNLGADGYIRKPVDFRKLEQVLEECLGKQRQILKEAETRVEEFMKDAPAEALET